MGVGVGGGVVGLGVVGAMVGELVGDDVGALVVGGIVTCLTTSLLAHTIIPDPIAMANKMHKLIPISNTAKGIALLGRVVLLMLKIKK